MYFGHNAEKAYHQDLKIEKTYHILAVLIMEISYLEWWAYPVFQLFSVIN